MVCAQLVAFGRVSGHNEEGTARSTTKNTLHMTDVPLKKGRTTKEMFGATTHANGVAKQDVANAEDEASDNHDESDLETSSTKGSDESESTDSEITS